MLRTFSASEENNSIFVFSTFVYSFWEISYTILVYVINNNEMNHNKLKYTSINPLTAKDEISHPENLTFLWSWILMWLGASRPMLFCVTLCPLINCPKTLKILAVKLSKNMTILTFFTIFIFLFNPICCKLAQKSLLCQF